MDRANIFVIGLDEDNRSTLQEIPAAKDIAFHPLLGVEELLQGEVSVPGLLEKAESVLNSFDGRIDGIVGYWDFPVSAMVPILCRRYGLRGPGLEAIAKCEHKYWSRLEQQKAIDEYPRFGIVGLGDQHAHPPEGMRFPMWLKPVKSVSSELAFRVADEGEFQEAIAETREGITRLGRPFEYILDQIDLPPEIEQAGSQACLAEEALSGVQVAVEGYVSAGDVTVYGILDSIDYPNSSCFLRHQYPSGLPEPVQQRLVDISRRVMKQIGLDSSTFSIEYFYDAASDRLSLLEINPRHSQSHARLFQYVDGVPNHHCMVSLALGDDPRLPSRQGPYKLAAKWYYRWFTDGVVRQVPTPEAIERLEQRIPGVHVEVIPQENQRLSATSGQDSYSYELAHIYVGADSEKELCRKYDRCVADLEIDMA